MPITIAPTKASATQIAAIFAFDVNSERKPRLIRRLPVVPQGHASRAGKCREAAIRCAPHAPLPTVVERPPLTSCVRTGIRRRRPGDKPLRRALSGERALDEMRRRERQRVAPEGGDDLDADRQPGGVLVARDADAGHAHQRPEAVEAGVAGRLQRLGRRPRGREGQEHVDVAEDLAKGAAGPPRGAPGLVVAARLDRPRPVAELAQLPRADVALPRVSPGAYVPG